MGMRKRDYIKLILQYLVQGVLILAPVSITGYFIYWLFTNIDRLLLPLYSLFSDSTQPRYIPGLGFVIIISFVILVGYLSSFFVVSRLIDFIDELLQKTPGIKVIYSFVKDFSAAFAGKKRRFKKAVLINIYNPDVWQIGFVTNEDVKQFGFVDYVTVYVPQSYAVAGHLFFVKASQVRLLTDIPAADALKFAISGGVVEVDEK
jgi:uncharacterized membrane protein